MAVGIFAGIAVRDYASALEWYKRLLGVEPSFYPNDIEAVWQLAENRFVYIVEDAKRAGGAVSLIWLDEPDAEVARIAERGCCRWRWRSTARCASGCSMTPTATRPESAVKSRRRSRSLVVPPEPGFSSGRHRGVPDTGRLQGDPCVPAPPAPSDCSS